MSLGYHEVVFDGTDLPSGMYFVKLTVDGGQSAMRKAVLMK
ncbi:MAG: T9SS type A sorting domain-containing protein [FCB group bacterium]|nr:T9SS type A sorting domain-containing protein [FCB group bacterium]